MQRRSFLLAASTAAQTWAGANDRLRIAIVGVGSRGSAHIKEILPVPNVEIGALVEVDGARAEAASQVIFQKTGKRPIIESDMRRIFDDKSIDAVTVATCNHWHALSGIWAMQDIVENNEVRALGHGHYHETYRKEADGQWRFASTHLTRLRVEVNSLGNWPVH